MFSLSLVKLKIEKYMAFKFIFVTSQEEGVTGQTRQKVQQLLQSKKSSF